MQETLYYDKGVKFKFHIGKVCDISFQFLKSHKHGSHSQLKELTSDYYRNRSNVFVFI